MTVRCFSFYRIEDGTFTGRRIVTSHPVAKNTPKGCGAVAGKYDARTQRVDLVTGEVVAYEAPPDARRERDRAEVRIAALESAQLRTMRELMLDPNNAEARNRLQATDAEIIGLRGYLE